MLSRRVRAAVASIAVEFALVTSAAYAQIVPAVLHAQIAGERAIDASGHGSVELGVHLTDAGARPFPKGTAARALIERGDAQLSSGVSSDLSVDDQSSVALRISPGTQAGPLVIRIDVGDAMTELNLTLTAEIREPLVVGFATGGIGPIPGWIEGQDNAPDGTNARRGAMSVFGTGALARNTRGTFAYDSSNTLEQTSGADPFLDNPDDRPFPTYGDASLRHADALSTNHFFGSVQNGESSAMWGQFYAHAAPSSAAGGYDVLVNGRDCKPTAKSPAPTPSPRATTSLTRAPSSRRPV
jgi:hypothetical protein